jgi:hypothetical protein
VALPAPRPPRCVCGDDGGAHHRLPLGSGWSRRPAAEATNSVIGAIATTAISVAAHAPRRTRRVSSPWPRAIRHTGHERIYSPAATALPTSPSITSSRPRQAVRRSTSATARCSAAPALDQRCDTARPDRPNSVRTRSGPTRASKPRHAAGQPQLTGEFRVEVRKTGRGERNCAVMSDAGAMVRFVRETVAREHAHTA